MHRKSLRLLVAIDFSPESQKALRAARDLASRTRASLTLAHIRPHSDVRAAVVEEWGDLLKGRAGTLRKAIAQHYQERLESFAAGGRGETHKLLSGKPSLTLLREARDVTSPAPASPLGTSRSVTKGARPATDPA